MSKRTINISPHAILLEKSITTSDFVLEFREARKGEIIHARVHMRITDIVDLAHRLHEQIRHAEAQVNEARHALHEN